jgi:hypothetical protein
MSPMHEVRQQRPERDSTVDDLGSAMTRREPKEGLIASGRLSVISFRRQFRMT